LTFVVKMVDGIISHTVSNFSHNSKKVLFAEFNTYFQPMAIRVC